MTQPRARRKRGTVRHTQDTLPLSKVTLLQNSQVPWPTMFFHRRRPHTRWLVPPVAVPLYWFDRTMMRKRLIEQISDGVFLAGGRRFHALVKDRKIVGVGYTRWLVYEERDDLPNRGRP